jgi:hypothetical protein
MPRDHMRLEGGHGACLTVPYLSLVEFAEV